MSFEEYLSERLWPLLVETVHSLVMYANHKAYARNFVLSENSDMKSGELAVRLRITVGEALVILYELSKEGKLKSGL
jgi:hypothetical protein